MLICIEMEIKLKMEKLEVLMLEVVDVHEMKKRAQI